MITTNPGDTPQRFAVCFLSEAQERRFGDFLQSLQKEPWSGSEVDRIEHRVRELLGTEYAARETTTIETTTHSD